MSKDFRFDLDQLVNMFPKGADDKEVEGEISYYKGEYAKRSAKE